MPCNSSCKQWMTGTNFYVYFSHFLSAWGDRMWTFGVGIFLINISPESLQLTAAYGLSMGLSVLLFGALIGDIVDETPRLKAAQTALILQNLFVVVCAIVVYLFLVFRTEIVSFGSWTTYATYAVIIIMSVLSKLTSMARHIAVEKDWIVEICGSDRDMLATMTASLRRIDLATQILAPLTTGVLMTFAGVQFGALFIAAWNLGSVVIEYYFLWKVYNTVPALKNKKDTKKSQVVAQKEENGELKPLDVGISPEEATVSVGADEEYSSSSKQETTILPNSGEGPDKVHKVQVVKVERYGCKCCRMLSSFERLYHGWPVYAKYDVLYSGIALSCLYFTVLGFDSVTIGYAKMQGVVDGLVGATMGIAALFGILGTFMYPIMRRRLGVSRTGIFGFSLQITCLVICVVSVWMPGSDFDLSLGAGPVTASSNCSQGSSELQNNSYLFDDVSLQNVTHPCFQPVNGPESYLAIGFLLTGIATSRFGLWVADLSINQLFMERVSEKDRGKVNGVQNSINELMEMLKFIMILFAPYPHQFGLLILISFSFICIGWIFYALFLHKDRGHFFHFEQVLSGCGKTQK